MGKFRGLDDEEGWIQRRFAALDRALQELAAARRLGLQSEVRQFTLDPAAIDTSNTWTTIATVPVTPPDGYNVALVQMVATAGVSWPLNVGGNVSVLPRVGSTTGIGQSQGGAGDNGHGAGCSVTGSLAARIAVTPGVPFNLSVLATSTPGWTPNTGNVRFSATILYTRE